MSTQILLIAIGLLCWLIESHLATLVSIKQDEHEGVVRLPAKPTKIA
ncbi:hypothetical protein HY065_03070 [Candidatus Berkelbacteria bacterium]|nr:hypothetical protein [Candidatus Berkelbacteria bacterium]